MLILIVIVLIVLARCLRIVPQAYVYVVERLGAYHASWSTGLHIAIPVIDRVSKKVNLKELVADFPPQPVITKDNVTMQIDTVIYMQITDPKLYSNTVQPLFSANWISAHRGMISTIPVPISAQAFSTISASFSRFLELRISPFSFA